LTHVNGSFDLLDTSSQLPISGYLLPHSFYNTADRTESSDIEFSADLLRIFQDAALNGLVFSGFGLDGSCLWLTDYTQIILKIMKWHFVICKIL